MLKFSVFSAYPATYGVRSGIIERLPKTVKLVSNQKSSEQKSQSERWVVERKQNESMKVWSQRTLKRKFKGRRGCKTMSLHNS